MKLNWNKIGKVSKRRVQDLKVKASSKADKAVHYQNKGADLEDSAKGFFTSFKDARKQGAKVNYDKAAKHKAESLRLGGQANRNSARLAEFSRKKRRSNALKATALTGAVGAGAVAVNQKKDR